MDKILRVITMDDWAQSSEQECVKRLSLGDVNHNRSRA